MTFAILLCCVLFVTTVGARAGQGLASDRLVEVTPFVWATGLAAEGGRSSDSLPVEADLSCQDALQDLGTAGKPYDKAHADSDSATYAMAVGWTRVPTDRASVTAPVGVRARWGEIRFELRGVGDRPGREISSKPLVDPLVCASLCWRHVQVDHSSDIPGFDSRQSGPLPAARSVFDAANVVVPKKAQIAKNEDQENRLWC